MSQQKILPGHSFRFTFAIVDRQHKKLIYSWVSLDHVKEWLHGEGFANTLKDLEKSLIGHGDFQHWLAFDNNVPFAYLLTSKIEKESEDECSRCCLEEGEAITLDMFICDTKYLGKGLAHTLIREFLLSQFPHVTEVFIDPEVRNTRAVHVYKKVGFQIIGEFIAKWHPVPHYQMRRNAPGFFHGDIRRKSPFLNRD